MNLTITPVSTNNKSKSFGRIRKLDLDGLGDKHNAYKVVTNLISSKVFGDYVKTHDLFIDTISARVVMVDPRRKTPFIYQFDEKTYTANIDKETSRLVAAFQEHFTVRKKAKKSN